VIQTSAFFFAFKECVIFACTSKSPGTFLNVCVLNTSPVHLLTSLHFANKHNQFWSSAGVPGVTRGTDIDMDVSALGSDLWALICLTSTRSARPSAGGRVWDVRQSPGVATHTHIHLWDKLQVTVFTGFAFIHI